MGQKIVSRRSLTNVKAIDPSDDGPHCATSGTTAIDKATKLLSCLRSINQNLSAADAHLNGNGEDGKELAPDPGSLQQILSDCLREAEEAAGRSSNLRSDIGG